MGRTRLDGRRRRPWWRLAVALPALAAVLATGCVATGTWTLQDVEQLAPPVAPEVAFTAVDCPAAGECVAAAVLRRTILPSQNVVLRQHGSGWEIVPLPGPIGSTFASVSCRAVDDCLVVGDPLDVHLTADGPAWVLAPSRAHADTGDETVECVAEGCLRLQETGSWWWDGTAWGPRVDLPAGFQPSERRVACTSSTQCIATASEPWIHGLVEGPMPGNITSAEWDGTSWSATTLVPGNTRGAGLACPAADDCFATTGIRSSRQWPPLGITTAVGLAHWDGTTWSAVPVSWPGATPTEPPMLACAGPTSCTFQTVQGWIQGGPDYLGHWDGASWTVTPVPAARFLDELSCPSDGDCVAVGEGAAQRLSGSTWADLTPVPADPDSPVVLGEVSCAGPDMCLAAGGEAGTRTFRAFDGTSWKAVAGAPSDSSLVDCAPTACFAASTAGVVKRWDGTSLSDLDPIPVPAGASVLDLDCPSVDWCITIAGKGFAPETPVALTWSPASGWTPLALPPVADLVLARHGVACDAPASCLAAVKTADGKSVVFHRLSGGAWTPVAPPPAVVTSLQFDDVDCPTADTCVVVGGASTNDGIRRVHAILRDGVWSVDGPSDRHVLGARVDCWSADGCAVSSLFDGMSVLRGTRWLPLGLPAGTEGAYDVSCPAPLTCEVVGPLVDGDARSPAARLDIDPK